MPVDMRSRPWYNPEMKTSTFIVPGLIAIVLTFTLMQYTATSIVRERELGTLEQLQVTPLTRTELIIGKVLPFIAIGYIQLTILVVLMRYLFGIENAGQHRRAVPVDRSVHRRRSRLGHSHLDDLSDADAGVAGDDVLRAAVRVPVGLHLSD